MKANQFLYLSFLNITFLTILFFNKEKLNLEKLIKNPLIIAFFCFILGSSLSMLNAINLSLSLEKLIDLINIFITLTIIIYIASKNLYELKYLYILLSLSLLIDVVASLRLYFNIVSITDFNLNLANEIRGYYGNKNITSAAIAFKIPFAILLLKDLKGKIFKSLTFFLLVFSFLTLLILSSRAVFLSIAISSAIAFVLISLKGYLVKKSFLNELKQLLKFLIPLIIAILIFIPLDNQNTADDRLDINTRISSITPDQTDESTNQRLRFYGHAINQITQTPIIGIGLGNWKLYSIKYEAKNMYSYIVPFTAHNDFLEIFAETGIIGFLSYAFFIYFVLRFNINNIFQWLNNEGNFSSVYMFMPFIIYFIDMNLNFPLSRPSMQIYFLLYILILFSYRKQVNAKV